MKTATATGASEFRLNLRSSLRVVLSVFVFLVLTVFRINAQTLPEVTVRFANPDYDCTTQTYCLDVEFQSDTPDLELFGMNVRFFYDDSALEFISMGDFQGGYGAVSPNPPIITTGNASSGPAMFGFTGAAEFVNGAVQLVSTGNPVYISTTGWTKLFNMCFHVDEAINPISFCPTVVWDLEFDPANGGFLTGDDGVVMTVVAPPPMQSAPTAENTINFNWEFDTTPGTMPYGSPVSATCISLDDDPPVFTGCPTNGPTDLGCNPTTLPDCDDILALGITANDICSGPLTLNCSAGEITVNGCARSQIFTLTATDALNNSATCEVTYTWTFDDQAPVLTVPATGLALGCNPQTLPTVASVIAASSVLDNCGATISAVAGDISGTCEKSQTFTVTATDNCGGLTDVETVTYTWSFDTQAPVLTVPTDGLALGCNPQTLPTVASVIAASSVLDNCGATITAVAGDISGTCEKSQTFTVTATDNCGGLTDVETVTYTWSFDDQAPVLTVPTDGLALGCNPQTLPTVASVIAASSVIDNCGATITAVAGDISGTCEKSQTFTVTATDNCGGLTDVETVTYTWTFDTQAPVLTVPATGLALGCNPQTLPTVASVIAASSVLDNCSATLTAVAGDITGTCEKSQTFTVTATDNCGGLTDVETVTYTWTVDTELPIFTGCPGAPVAWDWATELEAPECADALALVSVTDNCGTVTPVCQPGNVVVNGCNRSLTFTLTAEDNCENTAQCSVTFTWTVDDEDPQFVGCPSGPIALGCNPAELPDCDDALALVTVTDGCSGTLTPSCSPGSIIEDGCARSQIFTLTATDAQNNSAYCYVTYTWTVDTQAPTFAACPTAPIDLGCNPTTLPSEAMAIAAAGTVTDNCDQSLTMSATGGQITGTCLKTQVWTVTAATDCGPDVTCSVTYTWTDDTQAPTFAACPTAPIDLGCNPTAMPSEAMAIAAAGSVTDNCDATMTMSATGGLITGTCIKTQVWTVTAATDCGSDATCSVTYTWTDDTQAPTFAVCPTAPIDLGCNPTTLPSEAMAIAAAGTVTDNCDATLTMSATGGQITGTCLKTQVWTVTAATDCGPDATCSVTYTWTDDTQAPTFAACPTAPIDLGCNPTNMPSEAMAIAAAGNVTDNCNATLTMSASGGTITGTCLKTQVWTVTAATDCGPDATCSVTYTWTDDTQAPAFATCPTAPMDLGCNPTTLPSEAMAIAAAGTVTDNCDATLTMSATGGTITGTCLKTQVWTVTAATDCGPDVTCSVTYTWTDDTQAPVFAACPTAPIDLGCNPTNMPSEAMAIAAAGNVTDNCNATLTMSAVGGQITGTCIKTQIWTVTAATDCGPDATCSVTYTWTDDTQAPTFAACPTTPFDLGCNPTTLPSEAMAIAAAGNVTDNCDATLTMSASGGTIIGTCVKTQVWTVTAATDCGPDATCSVTYSWTDDTQAPAFAACPTTSIDLGCNPTTLPSEAMAIAAAGNVTDNCDATLTMSATGGTITGTCVKTQVWTVTAATDCGPDATCSVTYTWTDDTQAPAFAACPTASIDLGCNPLPAALPTEAMAIAAAGNVTDNCDATLTMSASGGTITGTCVKTQVWTVTAATDCGPDATCSVTYSWTDDTQAPAFAACPTTSIDLGCNPTTLPSEAMAIAAAGNVTDNCDATLTMSATGGTITGTCVKTQVWTVTAATDCGPDATCSVTYTWTIDTEDPIFAGCPDAPIAWDWATELEAPTCADALALVTVTDICGGTLTPDCQAGTLVVDECNRSLTFTLTAEDNCENTAQCSVTFTWTVDDDDPQFVGCPTGPIALGCNPAALPDCDDALALVTVTDGCSGTLTPSCSPGNVVEDGCARSQIFTLTATDAQNNSAYCYVTYTWTVDTQAPAFAACPTAPIDLGCNPTTLPSEAMAIAAAGTVTDNCDATLTMSATGGSVTGTCLKTQVWTVTAATDCGPDATCSVTYTWTDDTQAPAFAACPTSPIDLGCNPTTLPSEAMAIAAAGNVTDNCDATLTMSAIGGQITGTCVKTQVWTVTAATDCGPDATCSVTYTWTDDTQAPAFAACPTAPIDLGCNPLPAALPTEAMAIAAAGTVTDNCDATLTMSATGGSVTGTCLKTQVWTVTAATDCGPDATCSVTYTWTVDTEDPVFTGCPDAPVAWDWATEQEVPTCAEALALVTVTDNCGTVTPTCQAGTVVVDGCNRSLTFTLTAEDNCENSAQCSVTFTWTVDDDDPQFVGCPSEPIALGCNPVDLPDCADALALVTVTDGCSGTLTPDCSAGSVEEDGCTRSQIFTLTATDAQGNTANCYVTYTWSVVTAPVIANLHAGDDLGCNPTILPTCSTAVTASNECGSVEVNCSPGQIYIDGCNRSQTFTYTAIACGLSDTETVTYTWTVVTAPVLANLPAGDDLGCNPTILPTCSTAVTASNECGPVTVNCTPGDIVADGCGRSQSFTYTAIACGLSDTETVTYTWTVVTAPVLANLPEGDDLGCNPTTLPTCSTSVTASNECGPVEVICTPGELVIDGCEHSQTFTYTATACDLTLTENVTYTWTEDTGAPVISTTAVNSNFECIPSITPPVFTGLDNCYGIFTPSIATSGPVLVNGVYTQTWTATWTDPCGNAAIPVSITYSWTNDCNYFCTLTQGFYGNPGGLYCDGSTTIDLISSLLSSNPLVLGDAGNQYTIPTGGAQCVINILPGGGAASPIPNGQWSCGQLTGKKGTLTNTLLAQAITLGLNLRLDRELGDLTFQSATFFTRESTNCDDSSAEPIIGTEEYYTMPACIMNLYDGAPTVADIYALANEALGGNPVGCSLGTITSAIGIINDAMDECRFIYFYDGTPIAPPLADKVTDWQGEEFVPDVMMSAAPNPFQDQIEIKFNLNSDSRVSLEVYNLQGVKVHTIFEGEAIAGIEYTHTFAPVGNRGEQVYLVVLKSVYGATTKRIIKTY